MPVLIENVKKHNASRLVPETKHHDHVGDSRDGRLRPPDPVLGGTVRSMHKDTAVLGLPGELSRDNSRQAVPGGRWEPDDTAVRDPQSFCGQPGFDTRGPHQFRNIPGIPTRRPIPVQRIRRWCVCVCVCRCKAVVRLLHWNHKFRFGIQSGLVVLYRTSFGCFRWCLSPWSP